LEGGGVDIGGRLERSAICDIGLALGVVGEVAFADTADLLGNHRQFITVSTRRQAKPSASSLSCGFAAHLQA
jgi:hypothetical protein